MVCESDSREAVDVLSEESEQVLAGGLCWDCSMIKLCKCENTSSVSARVLTRSRHSRVSRLCG